MSPSEDSASIDWSLVSDVKASQAKSQVLKAINEQPQGNRDIADKLDLSRFWVRRNTKWLEEKELIEELTGKPNYHIYRITEKGEGVVEYL